MVHHNWMLRVYEWMGIERKVPNVIEEVMQKWKAHLEVRNGNKLLRSQWIDIKKGFLQGDTYSPVGFCCTEIPVMLLEDSDCYKRAHQVKERSKRTHSLSIDDLKTYQQNHQKLKKANEILVQASMDTGAIYRLKNVLKLYLKNGRIIKGEGLQILQKRMKALDPNENEIYKFLG